MTAITPIQADIKQCVFIAESFSGVLEGNPTFYDFNSSSALEYNLNWLAQNSVKECFIMYSESKKQVEEAIADLDIKEMKIVLMYCKAAHTKTLADMMRELDFQQTLSNDFLLVMGNVISNVNLKVLWREHLNRKEQSKMNILTIALENSSSDSCFVINQTTQEVFQASDYSKRFKLNCDRIKIANSLKDFHVRGDLTQAGVYACSLEVIKSFKETFEYHNMNDFINGILSSQLYTEKIFCYILKTTQKCTRLDTPYDYYKAYDNLLSRYYYPFLLERPPQLFKGKLPPQLLKYVDYNKYIKSDVPLRSIKVGLNTYIGQGCAVGADAELFKTILCKNSTVGKGCKLKYCIVVEGAVVPDDFKSENSLLKGVGDSFVVESWQQEVNGKSQTLQEEELFAEEEDEAENFDVGLKIILSETPSRETYEQLSSLRKHFNMKCREFATALIVGLQPSTVDDIQRLVLEWGELLQRTCQDTSDLLSAVADACLSKQELTSKFPHFLMHLYQKELIPDTDIISWYDNNLNTPGWKVMLQKSATLIDRLRQDDQEDQDQL